MIQVRHYCTQAQGDLRNTQEALRAGGPTTKQDVAYYGRLIEMLQAAIKFQLPEGGRYLDNKPPYSESELEMLSIPFELIALEYACDYTRRKDNWTIQQGQGMSSRRILLVRRLPVGYELFSVYYVDDQQRWSAAGVKAVIPPLTKIIHNEANGEQKLKCEFHQMAPTIIRMVGKHANLDEERMAYRMGQEIMEDANVVLQFMLAVSCSNVEIDSIPAPKALNKKRLRTGKLPFYEYKVLKIRQGYAVRSDEHGRPLGDRAGPRQHLRRGHIRHYDPAKTPRFRKRTSLWIEAMIVGDPTKGSIDKEYSVEQS